MLLTLSFHVSLVPGMLTEQVAALTGGESANIAMETTIKVQVGNAGDALKRMASYCLDLVGDTDMMEVNAETVLGQNENEATEQVESAETVLKKDEQEQAQLQSASRVPKGRNNKGEWRQTPKQRCWSLHADLQALYLIC